MKFRRSVAAFREIWSDLIGLGAISIPSILAPNRWHTHTHKHTMEMHGKQQAAVIFFSIQSHTMFIAVSLLIIQIQCQNRFISVERSERAYRVNALNFFACLFYEKHVRTGGGDSRSIVQHTTGHRLRKNALVVFLYRRFEYVWVYSSSTIFFLFRRAVFNVCHADSFVFHFISCESNEKAKAYGMLREWNTSVILTVSSTWYSFEMERPRQKFPSSTSSHMRVQQMARKKN